jgi:hypothetical protein
MMDEAYEEHAHEAISPIDEKQARIRLDALTLAKLNEIAKADGLPENPNRDSQIKTILLAWFHPVGGIAGQVISFQELLDQAENLPQHKRRAWRKKTHGKEMGI